ncbi:hypothetical protein [Salinigranum marinum]|uniref:hypothetical protein n=1 Tax=Salinigranum marinum TaxID=1515595 RepID=UPI002989BB82|nr:hypothetical protein [Salinigranum marinum]
MTRGSAVSGVVLVVALVTVAAAPGLGAAAGIGESSITPSTVETGVPTTLSIEVPVTGVNTGDGTTDGRVTVELPDAVDLSGASVTSSVATPNATDVSGAVDADAGTVSVTWDDDAGSTEETLTVRLAVDGVAVDRTGTFDVSARVDADADGTADVTTAVGEITAAAPGSDRSVTGTEGTLYLGERGVDVTGLDGANAAGESQQFYGVGGDADGVVAATDTTLSVDVTAANRFVPGSYALSSAADDPVVFVRRPRVTDLSLYAGASTSAPDVTNRSVPQGTDTLTVEAGFTFDDAENVTVSVDDSDGLDVTEQLTASPTITASGGTVALDVRDLPVGRYEVTAEGADDLDNASRTVPFRIRDPEKAVTLSKTRVVRGENTIVAVAGAPGDVRYLRLSGTALRAGELLNTATAREVFDRTGQVQSVGVDTDANVLYAVVALDDDGISEVRLRTDRLVSDSVDVESAPEIDAPVEDDVTLTVEERAVTVASPPPTAVGDDVTVTGTAPESERVKLYAAVDGAYVPLYDDADAETLAEPEVAGDGTWETDVDTSAVVDLPETYRVVAVGDPDPARLGGTEPIDSETLRELDPRESATLTTVEGALSLVASRTTLAATGTDEFTLSGAAVAGRDDPRLYHVGPRGTVDARTVDASADGFEETIDGIETRGVHTFVVVDQGRDGAFAYADGSGPSPDELLSGRETRSAAVATLLDAYTQPGSDDPIARVNVTGVDPSVSVSTPTDGDPLPAAAVPVSGQSTAEDGTTVFVELIGGDGTAARTAEAPVTNGTWNATLDLSGVQTGSYRLAADDGAARDSAAVTVAEDVTPGSNSAAGGSTPAEVSTTGEATSTPAGATSTPAGAATTTESEARTGPTTTTAATASSTSSTRFPGLGVGSGIGAVVIVVTALAVRSWRPRRRR